MTFSGQGAALACSWPKASKAGNSEADEAFTRSTGRDLARDLEGVTIQAVKQLCGIF
jgi:hypothetical protein